jgi:serine O-acetyltransferase
MHELIWRIRAAAVVDERQPLSFRRKLLRKIAGKAYAYCQSALGFYIPTTVNFRGEPIFPHGLSGIFISQSAELGPDCVIFHHVTIGSNTLITSRGLGVPRMGIGCYIGAGAKIIGGVRLGDYVVVGANALVTRDVPSNSTVVGFNQISSRSDPHDTRFFGNGRPWQVITATGRRDATPEESAHLDAAFSKKHEL